MSKKATPEELEQLIRSTTGSGHSFVLLCKYCRDIGSISAHQRTYMSEKHKRKAAEKFAAQAWRIEEGLPVCPACFLRRAGKEAAALPYRVYYSKSSKGFDNFDDMLKFLKELKHQSIAPNNIRLYGANMRRKDFDHLMSLASN